MLLSLVLLLNIAIYLFIQGLMKGINKFLKSNRNNIEYNKMTQSTDLIIAIIIKYRMLLWTTFSYLRGNELPSGLILRGKIYYSLATLQFDGKLEIESAFLIFLSFQSLKVHFASKLLLSLKEKASAYIKKLFKFEISSYLKKRFFEIERLRMTQMSNLTQGIDP